MIHLQLENYFNPSFKFLKNKILGKIMIELIVMQSIATSALHESLGCFFHFLILLVINIILLVILRRTVHLGRHV